jgi:D-alanyl-D-alanine carboxypeptidase (penicillin-binding protein 5/6)
MKHIQGRMKKAILIVCCVTCLFVGMQPMYHIAAENSNHIAENPGWADSPSIMGESGIVMEISTGSILYEKNMHDIHYPASITKIMTALLAIENCEMDEIVTVPPEAVYMEDKGTHIALDAGEQLTVEQCLYAIMLASANDAAYALAEHVGGTYENFIRMMNEKAKELGCQNTNFTNPHGLPDENHVTSAYDMALITKAALQWDMFQTVSGASYYARETNWEEN